MAHAEPAVSEHVVIAIIDPDMIFVRPLTTLVAGEDNILLLNPNKGDPPRSASSYIPSTSTTVREFSQHTDTTAPPPYTLPTYSPCPFFLPVAHPLLLLSSPKPIH